MLKRLSSRGDTIVEVMIALAVLSLAFSISYATASHALEKSQNAQEHALALDYLDGQLEALHYILQQPSQSVIPATTFSSSTQFCLKPISPPPRPPALPISYYTNSGKNCLFVGLYTAYIESQGSNGPDYHVFVSWEGLGSLGIQREELSYRIYGQ